LRFTVAIGPRVLETTDRATALAFQSIYVALLDELRSVPNLDLVEVRNSADREFAPDFELRAYVESRDGPSFHVSWLATRGGRRQMERVDCFIGSVDSGRRRARRDAGTSSFPISP
jgi:hypothetical protein